ncbi:MAG: SDR family NAD(P)-dependent oxidoreductase [Reichenbachiella sp.]
MSLSGKWVLITGASSGLGEEMALQLSSKYNTNLILVARRENKLIDLKRRINDQSTVHVEYVMADLSKPEDTQTVINLCLSKDGFYGAILNAGITYLGKYIKQEQINQAAIITLNIQSTVQLTDAVVKHFESTNKEGRLMVISSLAAKVPAPYQAVYSGTKAFLTNFFHSLKNELTNKSFKLSVFSPGGIKTDMTKADGFQDFESYLMPVKDAATQAITTFLKGKHDHIPGLGNRIGVGFLSLIPTRVFSKVMGNKYLKSIEKTLKD